MAETRGLIHLLQNRWDAVWQVRQEVAIRLARTFPSVWLEPPRHWRDPAGSDPGRFVAPDPVRWPGLTIYRHGPLLPAFHRPPLSSVTDALRLRACRRYLLRAGCRSVGLVVWWPAFLESVDRVPHDFLAYYVDDEYSYDVDGAVAVSGREEALLRRSDAVFIHSPRLMSVKGGYNEATFPSPNGVDFRAYATPAPPPTDLASIPGPRVGYLGFLKKQLDWELIGALVRRHPEWSFVFVGPEAVQPGLEDELAPVRSRPNAHFLGVRPKAELPGYAQHFDVCLMPYRVTPYTHAIYPLKLHEYLAAGRPVVSSPIESVRDFGHVVRIADGVEDWSRAIASSLDEAGGDDAAIRARRAAAKANDWDVLVARTAEHIRDAWAAD